MLIVADAGPILSFVRAGYFDLLRGVVGTLTIPEAVYAEIVVQSAGKPDAEDVRQAAWIRRETVADRSFKEAKDRGIIREVRPILERIGKTKAI